MALYTEGISLKECRYEIVIDVSDLDPLGYDDSEPQNACADRIVMVLANNLGTIVERSVEILCPYFWLCPILLVLANKLSSNILRINHYANHSFPICCTFIFQQCFFLLKINIIFADL